MWQVFENCNLANYKSSQHTAKEVHEPDLSSRWTHNNFKLESVKFSESKSNLDNGQPSQ